MDLTRVQDKLAEAQFFLDKMTEQEPRGTARDLDKAQRATQVVHDVA